MQLHQPILLLDSGQLEFTPLIAMQFLVQDLPAKGVQIRQQKVYSALLLIWLKLFVISGGTASLSNRGLASTNELVLLYWTQ